MQTCKYKYDYEQLITNYIEYNLNKDIKYNNDNPLPDCYTSTAKGILSFNGPYLISYTTPVAKLIHTKYNTYLFIDSYKYSATTTKQLAKLTDAIPAAVVRVYVTDLESSFKSIANKYMSTIYATYKRCIRARNAKHIKITVAAYKNAMYSILPELHHQTRKATLRKLGELPNIPDKLNKFTRPIMLSVLKDKGLL